MSSRFGEEVEVLEKWPRERPGQQGGKRAENRRKRLDKLCEAGLELFLERGVGGVTVEDITQSAGIAKGSFYRYFRDKEELVEAIIRPVQGKFVEAMDECKEGLKGADTENELLLAYGSLAGQLTEVFLPYRDVVQLYLQEYRAPAVKARKPIRVLAQVVLEKSLEATSAAHKHGLLRAIPHRISTLVVIGAVERLLFGYLQDEPIGEPMEVAASLLSLVMDGLRNEGQR